MKRYGHRIGRVRWRGIVACVAVGLVLTGIGLLSLYALAGAAGFLVVLGPVAYAWREVFQRTPEPKHRYDAIGDDIDRMIERGRLSGPPRRPRSPDR